MTARAGRRQTRILREWGKPGMVAHSTPSAGLK